jgi:hypothetical protein
MSLRICIECGAPLPRASRPVPCVACGARAPAWRAVPLTAGEVARRLGLAAGALVVAAVSFAGIAASMWTGAGDPLQPLQVVLSALMIVVAGVVNVKLLSGAFARLFRRDFRHDEREGERSGNARTVLGRLVQGEGRGTRVHGPFAPNAPSLAAAPAFASIRALSRELQRRLRSAHQPNAVETAVLAALLGLASRGRCELVVRVTRGWAMPSGGRRVRRPDHCTVMVQRVARGRDLPLEQGWVENTLLAALDALTAGAPRVQGAQLGPYRAGAQEDERRAPRACDAIQVEALLAAFTGGRPNAVGWLRGILKDEARRAQPPAPELEAQLAGELHEALGTGTPRSTPGRALMTQVQVGLAHRA